MRPEQKEIGGVVFQLIKRDPVRKMGAWLRFGLGMIGPSLADHTVEDWELEKRALDARMFYGKEAGDRYRTFFNSGSVVWRRGEPYRIVGDRAI